jgi:glutaredoxin
MFGIKYIHIYGLVRCGYCAKAVHFLNAAGIEYAFTLCDRSSTMLHEVKKATGRTTVPIIVEYREDDTAHLIGGYDNLVGHMRSKYGLEIKPTAEVEIRTGEIPEGEE